MNNFKVGDIVWDIVNGRLVIISLINEIGYFCHVQNNTECFRSFDEVEKYNAERHFLSETRELVDHCGA